MTRRLPSTSSATQITKTQLPDRVLDLLRQGKQRRQGVEREEAEGGEAEAAAGPTRRVTRLSLGSDRDMTLSGGLPHPRSPIKAS